MSLCPKDGKPCCDDLCYAGGCLMMDGYHMLEVCDACGGTIDEVQPECGTCRCDYCDDEYTLSDES